jgi:hypothetical protein
VHCQRHSAELADAVAVVRRGRRAQAIVIRLEASGGRWVVTVLEVLATAGRGCGPPAADAAEPDAEHAGGWPGATV